MTEPPTHETRSEGERGADQGTVRGSIRTPASGRLAVGATFAGRYEVQGVLGDGACGTVYAARQIEDGRDVALKVIHPHLVSDEQVSKRFLREAAILGRLNAPSIARIYDSDQDASGLLYMALERVEGDTLSEVMSRQPELPLSCVAEVIVGVCSALAVAHEAGVIHRDLKPDNVIVRMDAERVATVKVLDFGLSKMLHGHLGTTNLTTQNMVLGTPEYMAPEQARGDDVDGRCDVYSAGVILYELLAGRRLFGSRQPLAQLTAHLTESPAPLETRPSGAAIAPSLAAVAMHALAKKRAERYADADAMALAVRHAIEAPDDLVSIRPPPADRESLPYRDTDRFSAVHAAPGRPSSRQVPRSSWGSALPVWLLVAIGAAALGVLAGVLFALRC